MTEEMTWNELVDDGNTPKVEPKPWMKKRDFVLIESIEQLKQVVDQAIEAGYCSVDLETTGLDNRIDESGKTKDDIVGYCLAYNAKKGFYVPVNHVYTDQSDNTKPHPANLNDRDVALEIKRLCENCVTIYHNSRFDLEFLRGMGEQYGFEIDDPNQFEDTLILDYVKDSTQKQHGLKYLSREYLGWEMIELSDLFMGKDRNFATLDPTADETLWYACPDAICTWALYQWYRFYDYKEEKAKLSGRKPVIEEQPEIYEIEKSLIPALRWMERNRPKVDRQYTRSILDEAESYQDELVREIEEEFCREIKRDDGVRMYLDENEEPDHQHFRHEFDVASPAQLGKALAALKENNTAFANVELERTEKSDQVRTDNDYIEYLAKRYGDRFPLFQKIQNYRSLQKAVSTYIKPVHENTDHNETWIDESGKERTGNPNIRRKIMDNTTRFKFRPFRVDTGRFSADQGKSRFGYSGINVQSTPACYNYAKFITRKINSRPQGLGDPDAELAEGFVKAKENTDFLKQVHDNHFVIDNKTDTEHCIRKSCEGCPFIEDCDHEEPSKHMFYSLEAAVRPAVRASEGYAIVAIDFASLELRVAANICEEPKWLDEYYRCGNCAHEFEQPEKQEDGTWILKEKPTPRCPECGSDKIGDLHTLTAKIIYGDHITDLPDSDFKQKRQDGKCVIGETLVQTDQGLVRIEDLDPGSNADEFVEFESPITVWTDDGYQKATHFYNGGIQKTYRIETKGRYSLEGSGTHRIRVYDRERGYSWKHLSNITEKDYVVIDRGNPCHKDQPTTVQINPFKKVQPLDENAAKQPLTKDWMYFLGMYTGDGYRTGDSVAFTYDLQNEKWEEKFATLLEKIGLTYTQCPTDTKKNTGTFQIHSRKLCRFLDTCGAKKLSKTARVPHVVFNAGPSYQKSFLKGLFDADGWITKSGYPKLGSSSLGLLEDVQVLLASIGILSSIRVTCENHELTGDTYWELCLGGTEAVRYGKEINFVLEKKNARIIESAENRDKIPFPEKTVPPDTRHKPLRQTRKRQGLTYNMIDRYRDVHNFPEEILWLRDRDVRILPVNKITTSKQQVYDLTVPETESFWADGFINHNSANFAIIYMGGPSTIARNLGESFERGKEIRDAVYNELNVFSRWINRTVAQAHIDEQVTTTSGRKVRLKDINHEEDWIRKKQERNSVNSIVQGSATGDLIKYAMGEVYKEIRDRDWMDACRMLLTMHDELVFEIKKDKLDEILPVIDHNMTKYAEEKKWSIPLVTDIELGQDWGAKYDWREMHNTYTEDGIAVDPVPEFLVNHIEFEEGMWYEDDEGDKQVWNGSRFVTKDRFLNPNESPSADTTKSDADKTKDTSEADMSEDPETDNTKDDGNNDSEEEGQQLVEKFAEADMPENYTDYPIHDHTIYDALATEREQLAFELSLGKIKRACKGLELLGLGKRTHALRVVSATGNILVNPNQRLILVNPEIFEILAFYEGL